MYLNDMLKQVKIDLKDDTSSSRLWKDDELKRCIERAVTELSKYIPRELVYELTTDFTVEDESSTAPAAGTYLALDNKPIKPDSVTITDSAGGTTYTIDTDYIMDYNNGKYTIISDGSITASDSLLVSYTKSRLGIDISSLSDNLIRITHVEYPVGQVPQQFVSYAVWGGFMYIGSRNQNTSQKEMDADGEHVGIYYEDLQTPPLLGANGTYPEHMDNTVILGANAYALEMKSLQFEHQAATDIASARTTLSSITAVHTLADAALDKVAVYLESNTNEDAKFWLTKITTDIAGLRTAFLTAVDAANAKIDAQDFSSVATYLGSAVTALGQVPTNLTTNAGGRLGDIDALKAAFITAVDAAATQLGLVNTNSIDKATTGAEAYLDTGDGNINTLNTGKEVAENYANYSNTRVAIANARTQSALGYIQEGAARLSNMRDYIDQATTYTGMANGFIGEASREVDMAVAIVNREVALGQVNQVYIMEANARLDNLRTYIEQAAGWVAIANGFVREAEARIAEIDRYITTAQQYVVAAEHDITLSDRYRTDSDNRFSEFRNILKDRREYRKRISGTSVRQNP